MFLNISLSLLASFCLTAGTPHITVDRNSHSFGRISPKEKTSTRFQVSNEGDGDLKLLNISTSCGCTSAVVGQSLLKSGEHSVIEVIFDPKKDKGKVEKTLSINSNDPKTPRLELSISAEVVPAILVSQDELFFPGLLRSDVSTQVVRYTSTSGKELRFQEIQVAPLPYLRVERKLDGKDAKLDGKDVTLQVTIVGAKLPTDKETGQESVVLRTNDAEMPELTLSVYWAKGKAIQTTPVQLAFEPTHPGAESSLPVSLKHLRNQPFRVLAFHSTSPAFRVNCLPTPAATVHDLTVVLDSKAPIGHHAGRVFFKTDDPDQAEILIDVMAYIR